MKKTRLLVATIGSLLAFPVLAEETSVTQHKEDIHVTPASGHTLTANVSLVSDYLYRGISQTGTKPAIQGGFDYARSGGFYAGVWGSSISWISDSLAAGGAGASNAGVEVDTYLGFKNNFATDFSYDVGYLRYNYPAGNYTLLPNFAKADTDEVYGALGYKWLILKYSYSLGDTFMVSQARGTSYVDLSANYPIADTGITLGAHFGRQSYKGTSASNLKAGGADPSYSDYKLSVTRDFSGFVLGLAYSKTNASTAPGAFYKVLNRDLGQGKAVLSLSRSF
ncbi:MAG: hypothetical protein HY846_02165 [Nitrosomonadales bacterium]|nr:hypothetical protein [Nitrosomonadales bacterium]